MTTETVTGATGDSDMTTETVTGVTGDSGMTTGKVTGATGDSDMITKETSERIVEIHGVINCIILQGRIAGTDILPSVIGMDIPVNITGEEVGPKITDVRFLPSLKIAATEYEGCRLFSTACRNDISPQSNQPHYPVLQN
jgi:hypothetical protein